MREGGTVASQYQLGNPTMTRRSGVGEQTRVGWFRSQRDVSHWVRLVGRPHLPGGLAYRPSPRCRPIALGRRVGGKLAWNVIEGSTFAWAPPRRALPRRLSGSPRTLSSPEGAARLAMGALVKKAKAWIRRRFDPNAFGASPRSRKPLLDNSRGEPWLRRWTRRSTTLECQKRADCGVWRNGREAREGGSPPRDRKTPPTPQSPSSQR